MIFKAVIAFACLGYVVNGQIIGPCSTLGDNVTSCTKDIGSDFYTDKVTYTYIQSLFTRIDRMKLACNSTIKDKFTNAVKCITNSYRHCGDNDFKTLIPTADKHAEAFEYVCGIQETADHILNCLSSSYEDCTANKYAREGLTGPPSSRSSEFSKFVEYYCGVIRVQDECVANDIDVQECMDDSAYDVYVKYRSMLKPEACGASAFFLTSSLLIISLILSSFQ